MAKRRSLAVIDLQDIDNRPADVSKALLSAAENDGFFYLVNHGVPQFEVDAAYELSRAFFNASDEVKNATRGDTTNAHYVLGFSTEELDCGTMTMREGMLCGACSALSHECPGMPGKVAVNSHHPACSV
jgi:isopenicillin N synthase-like dioxygenase